MSSGQGWFESDEDYQARISQEANERIIEDATGDAPKQGWLESDDDYQDRVAQEASERIVEDSTGESPTQGWLEDDAEYRDRIAREANERIVADTTGEAPKQGFFESAQAYDTRVRREANEGFVERSTGAASKQGWLEGDHDYRSRIAHEAREIRVNRERASGTPSGRGGESDSSSYQGSGRSGAVAESSSSGQGILLFLVVAIVGVIALITSSDQTREQQPAAARSGLPAASPAREPPTQTDSGSQPNSVPDADVSDSVMPGLTTGSTRGIRPSPWIANADSLSPNSPVGAVLRAYDDRDSGQCDGYDDFSCYVIHLPTSDLDTYLLGVHKVSHSQRGVRVLWSYGQEAIVEIRERFTEMLTERQEWGCVRVLLALSAETSEWTALRRGPAWTCGERSPWG